MKIGIIDGDSLCYISSRESIEESISNIDSLITNIINYNKLTHYYIFLSLDKKYFRHNINKEYKAKRKASSLKFLKTLKSYLIEEYKAISINNIEADDLVAFTANELSEKRIKYITCSPDKDVIKQVIGPYFNYKKFEKGIIVKEDAYKFLMKQTLMGDSVDNIIGIPGIGDSKSDNIINECSNLNEIHTKVINEYIKYYKNIAVAIYNFQMNFRQVYLLRTKQDYINELGFVPEYGPPIEIKTQTDV